MVEPEPRIVLINEGGNVVEVRPTAKGGAGDQLAVIRYAVIAGLEAGLFETSPFVISQPDVIPITNQEQAVDGPGAPAQTSRQHTLELARAHYKEKLQEPQRLYEFYQACWDYYGIELMSLSQKDTRVADVPYKEDEIWQFMKLEKPQYGNPDADFPYFQLPVLASSDARALIGRGFSNLGYSVVFQSGYEIKNGHQTSGWMRVDASLDSPYRRNSKGELTGLNVDELKKAIKADSRVGQTVNIYGPSGNVIKQIFGYYPDQGATWSRLPESLLDGRVLGARFLPDGSFDVDSGWGSRARYPETGGRSFLGA